MGKEKDITGLIIPAKHFINYLENNIYPRTYKQLGHQSADALVSAQAHMHEQSISKIRARSKKDKGIYVSKIDEILTALHESEHFTPMCGDYIDQYMAKGKV